MPVPNSVTAPPPSAEPLVGYFLLRTGFLMQGTATCDGKRYALKTDFGTMQIPVANVEFVGKTLIEIYEYKNSFVNRGNCNELLKFGEWCIKNGLKDEGVALFHQAKELAPNDVLREVIQNRLNEETAEKSEIAAVKSETRTETPAVSISVPKSVTDYFARKVQPALVQRCAAADCHGSKSEHPFRLSIPQQIQGTTTNRNLQAVLPWIDLDYPTESRLLAVLVSNHGGNKAPYSVESPQYNNTVQWIQLAAKELPVEQRRQPSDKEMPKTSPEPLIVKPDLLPQGFQDIKPLQPDSVPPVYQKTNLPVLSNSSKDETFDPLDPEIFNQRYHKAVDEKPSLR